MDADRRDITERLAALTAAAVPRPDIDAEVYVRRRLDEDAIGADLIAACRPPGDAADLVAAWAAAEPGTDEAARFVAVRALGWEILLADPALGGDHRRRGWEMIGHAGRPKNSPRS
ncbi:MAG: hypothetical protein RIE08_16370 [Acidimicrobiales bacterium]